LNGNIRTQFNYKVGKLVGKGHAWSESGKLVAEFTLKNDEVKKVAYYDGLNREEAMELLDKSKVKGERGSKNHNRYFVFFPCGEDTKSREGRNSSRLEKIF